MGVCRDAGIVHILGNTEVLARRDSKLYKKTAVDYIYMLFFGRYADRTVQL
jgi:KUP system potassium uptake protein